MIQYMLSSCLL